MSLSTSSLVNEGYKPTNTTGRHRVPDIRFSVGRETLDLNLNSRALSTRIWDIIAIGTG